MIAPDVPCTVSEAHRADASTTSPCITLHRYPRADVIECGAFRQGGFTGKVIEEAKVRLAGESK